MEPIARQSELARLGDELKAELQALRDAQAKTPELITTISNATQAVRELPAQVTSVGHWMALDTGALMVAWFTLLTGYRIVCKLFKLLTP